MTEIELFRNIDLWRKLKVNVLFTISNGELSKSLSSVASEVYPPSFEIPAYALCRTSDSSKRLERGLELEEAAKLGSGLGVIYNVIGGGSPIGVVVQLNQDRFQAAHFTPDGLHLINSQGPLASDSIVKGVYTYKTFRSFLIGPEDREAPHDVVLTAKTRWFRKRNNPKSLGFSKDKA